MSFGLDPVFVHADALLRTVFAGQSVTLQYP